MVQPESLLVTLVQLVDRIPEPPAPTRRQRGRPKVHADRLIIKALIIMIIRRLYTATCLLNFLDQPTALTQQLRALLTHKGQLPSRRMGERRLEALPNTCRSRLAVWGVCWWSNCNPGGSGDERWQWTAQSQGPSSTSSFDKIML